MVVLWVLVEDEIAEIVHGNLVPWPDFGYIKGIEAELVRISFFGLHDLYVSFPGKFFAFLDGFPELLLRVVWVFAQSYDGFRLGELLLAVGGEKLIFDVDKFAIRIDPGKQSVVDITAAGIMGSPFEDIATKAMVVDASIRCPMVAEEHQTSIVPMLPSQSINITYKIFVERPFWRAC